MADPSAKKPNVRAKILRHLIQTSLLLGGGIASILSLTTWFQRQSIVRGLTTNAAVQSTCLAIFPAVLITQVCKGLAYPVNGIIMGGLDWVFTMLAMWAANFVCVGMIYGWKMTAPGAGGLVSLNQIWWALAAFMATQVVTGIVRYNSQTGVWKALRVNEK